MEMKRAKPRVNALKLTRAAFMFANLILWPYYANLLRAPLGSMGYSFQIVKHVGLVIGAAAAVGWLCSIRIGILVQSVLVIALVVVLVW